jgi:hypothetical protein
MLYFAVQPVQRTKMSILQRALEEATYGLRERIEKHLQKIARSSAMRQSSGFCDCVLFLVCWMRDAETSASDRSKSLYETYRHELYAPLHSTARRQARLRWCGCAGQLHEGCRPLAEPLREL